jgi:uncharacterized membrane protein YccC
MLHVHELIEEADTQPPTRRRLLVGSLGDEAAVWLFVLKTLLAYYLAGWLAMRFSLPQPSTAMLTTIIVANRQSGMVLAKSFYRGIGTLVGAGVAILIVGLFPQQRVLFLLALSLWIGLCVGGATLYRNFTFYGFVLAGYTGAIVAVPVIDRAPDVFDSAIARVSEVLLGVLVSGVVNDAVFPSRIRDALHRSARAQFAHFIGLVRRSTSGRIARDSIEKAHLRFVRDAVELENLRSVVIFEDAEARARSRHLLLFNQKFMVASSTFQSLHQLVNRLESGGHDAPARALIELYALIGTALDLPHEAGHGATVALPRLAAARQTMDARVPTLRARLAVESGLTDFDTGATLLRHFADELHDYIRSAASMQAPRLMSGSGERTRFTRGNDFLGAAFATLRSILIMLALGTFWIASAWPVGLSAMLIASIMAGLFASSANPALAIRPMLVGWTAGLLAAFVCVFFVLARMDGYGLLVAGSAPFLIVGVAMMMWPSMTDLGVGYSMGFSYILAVKNPMVFDPVHFMNDSIAQTVGLAIAAIAFLVVPSAAGCRWLRHRQVDRLRRQVALAAEAPLAGLRHRFECANRDLFSQIVAQTEPGRDSRALVAWALAVHETGRAIIELRNDMAVRRAPAELSVSITFALGALGRFFGHPDGAGYLVARDAVAKAIVAARESAIGGPLLDHLHLIRLALLDGKSVLADYMPPVSIAGESAHAS